MNNENTTVVTIEQLPQEYQDLYNLYEEEGATDELAYSFEQLDIEYPSESILSDTASVRNFLIVSYLVQHGVCIDDIYGFFPPVFLIDEDADKETIDHVMEKYTCFSDILYSNIRDAAYAALDEHPIFKAAKVKLSISGSQVELDFPKRYSFKSIERIAFLDPRGFGSSVRDLIAEVRELRTLEKVPSLKVNALSDKLKESLSRYAEEIVSEYFSYEYVKDEILYAPELKRFLVSNNGDFLLIGDEEIPDVSIPEELFSRLFG